jgi:hypothetical protein
MQRDEQNKTHLHMFYKKLNKNHLNQIFNFQQPKNPSLFFILFFLFCFGPPIFLLLSFSPISYSQPYFFYRTSLQFGPLSQFPLVIFDFQTLAVAFGRPGRRATLRCVICLRHRGDTSPPPSLPLKNGCTTSPPLPCFHLP